MGENIGVKIMKLWRFISKERELKMVWETRRDEQRSYLAGTAHFFPYSFKTSLSRYISNVNTVLLEGPLDESAMEMVVERASGGKEPSLYNILDARTINKIKRELAHPLGGLSSFASYMDVFKTSGGDLLYRQIKGQSPWMAFFNIWSLYLKKRGWRYTMDLDALGIAKQLGKEVYFLEKIEEQLEALKGIPLERIVNFLQKIERWNEYARRYVTHYLRGDLEGLMSAAREFPTRCEAIIEKRDPILYKRMKPFFEKGNTIAIVGITHIQGIKRMFLDDGYVFEE
jgi:uncharacterized protein YbaP (TraB family)